jgi:hypothetical protein
LPTWLLTAAFVLFILQLVAFGLLVLFLYYARH